MKKILCTLLSLVCAATAFSQSAREIITRMVEFVESHEAEGICLTQKDSTTVVNTSKNFFHEAQFYNDTLIIAGIDIHTTTERFYYLNGNYRRVTNTRVEVADCSKSRMWIFNPDKNEIIYTIPDKPNPPTMWLYLQGIYDVRPKAYRFKLVSETDDTWTISAKRKTITRQKQILYVVKKDTYEPLTVKVYDNYKVGKEKIHEVYEKTDIRFGVSQDELSFHIEDYPGAKIIDKTR